MIERWKPYHANPKYELSDEGRIRRTYKNGRVFYLKYIETNGRCQVAIGPKNKKVNISRAIWETFKGPIPEGYIITFKNGCHTMCDLYNLQLVENTEFKRQKMIERNKKRAKRVIDNKTGIIYKNAQEAEKALFVGKTVVRDMCKGITKKSRVGIDVSFYEDKTCQSNGER